MPEPAQVLLGSLAIMLIAGSLAIWLWVGKRWKAGQPILPVEPRVGVPWRAIDLYVILLVYLTAQILGGMFVVRLVGRDVAADTLSPDVLVPVLISNALANLVVVLLSVAYLRLRCGPVRRHLGFLPWRPGYDLRLGVATFVAALVPVLGIQTLLTQIFKSEHPVQLLLTKDSSPQVLLVCFFTAVMVAPLAEELLFRVFLQGWMEALNLRWRRQRASEIVFPVNDVEPSLADPSAGDAASASSKALSPELMPWPILLSAFAFALVHLGNGPDPIALFVLAVMLGYLYQKTHRIWPSLVVHVCLNSWSLAILWLDVKFGLTK